MGALEFRNVRKSFGAVQALRGEGIHAAAGADRLVDQVAVPRDTNEEAALATHLPQMDLAGVCLTADAAHTTKANCRQLTQGNGAEFLLFLKANQPLALAKAEQLLPGKLPPSGPHAGQRPRTH